MLHVHCIIYSPIFTPGIIQRIETSQEGDSIIIVTKSYQEISVQSGKMSWTGSLPSVIRHLRSQQITSFSAHFLSTLSALMILCLSKKTLVKWFVWGGDFYDQPSINKTLLGNVRKYSIIERIGYQLILKSLQMIKLIVANKADQSQITNLLNPDVEIASLNHLWDISQVQTLRKTDTYYAPKILVGNSNDPSNNHLLVLQQLQQANTRYPICIPLSGQTNQYIDRLKSDIETIIENDCIEYIDTFLPSEQYHDILSTCSHLAYGHYRQQGMATLFSFLISGKVCLMQSKNPYYLYLKNLGAIIFPLDQIEALPMNLTDKEKHINKQIIKEILNPTTIDKQWRDVLNFTF